MNFTTTDHNFLLPVLFKFLIMNRISMHFLRHHDSSHLRFQYMFYKGDSSSSSGTELPLMVESYGLLNDIFPFPSILDAGYTIFNLHLANVLFDVFLPSVLGSSL